ncbi:MAG TPA: hypothetical protein VLE93_03800 [Candidatus Saccharimonadales bacterium]|nr:hypothetical protein [Candidatus Saccharimonadales bacterium]
MPLNRWLALKRRVTSYRESVKNYLGEHEKGLLALLSVVIVISGTFWFRQYAGNNSNTPSQGGTFVDGVVGDRQQIEDEAAHLTKAGLFRFDQNGNLTKQLVKDWSASTDQTVFHLTLLPQVPLGEIQNSLNLEANLLGDAAVTTENNQLVITLQNADPSLPLLLAEPLFDFGPFKVSKLTNQSAVLVRNTRSGAANSYINRVIINAYPTAKALQAALNNHKIDGAHLETTTAPRGYQLHPFGLSLYYAVFFNLNRAPFRDQSFGQKIAAGGSIPTQPFTLTAPSSEPYQSMAKDLVGKWQAAGAKVTLELKSESDIKDQIAPARNFQALLGGLDYSYELDPFYLWDQSQVRPPGNNLSGVKSDAVETAINQIRAQTNIAGRKGQIETLHQTLQNQGVAVILGEQKASYVVSNAIRSVDPWVADSPTDWLQAFALWSVK